MSSRLPWAIGNVISRNHIHHCGTVDNFGAAIHVHGLNCQDNVIANNSIHDMPHHAVCFSMGFGRNIVYFRNPEAALLRVRAAKGIAECDHNLYFQASQSKLRVVGLPEESFDRWREMGFDQHSVVADPLFVDPDRGELHLVSLQPPQPTTKKRAPRRA